MFAFDYELIQTIPSITIFVSMAVMLVTMVLVFLIKRDDPSCSRKCVLGLAVAEYYFLILYLAVFGRSIGDEPSIELMPFWSYKAYLSGTEYLLQEIVMNVLVFIPVGFGLGGIITGRSWRKALLVGLMMSMVIESLQLVLHCGLCETDDLIHNVLGCMIGFGIYSGTKRIIEMLQK